MGQLHDWLDLAVIDIDQSQCLNYKSTRTICQRCVEVCPTDALQISDGRVFIKEKLCVDCTACVSSCPTLSIDYSPKPFSKTINEIKAYPDVRITCNQFDKYQKGIKIPCYRYLDEAMVFHYMTVQNERTGTLSAADGCYSLELFVGKCQTCKYNSLYQIEDHLHQLQQWFEQIGIAIEFRLCKDDQPYLEKQDETVSGITRRSLLKSFGFRRLKEPEQENKIEADNLSYRKKYHYKRKLLQKGLTKFRTEIYPVKASDIKYMPSNQFAFIDKTDNCRKCDICMNVCPTGALVWKHDENLAELHFDPQMCIACHRCEICPEKSISLVPLTIDQYFSEQVHVLTSLKVRKCSDCKDVFKVDMLQPEQTLCQLCQIKEEKIRALFG